VHSTNEHAVATLWWAAVMHFFNDGLTASLAVLLPLITLEMDLSYSQAGSIKTVHSLLISLSQLPASWAAGIYGEALSLGIGLAWFGLSFLLAAVVGGYLLLVVLMGLAGLGGGVYHPVGTSLVSRAYLSGRRGAAVGTLNFSGDLGKMAIPAAIGLIAARWGWHLGAAILGAITTTVAVTFLLAVPRFDQPLRPTRTSPSPASGDLFASRQRFAAIAAIGFIDQASRSAVMAFLGFLLLEQGFSKQALAWLITVTFAGGAMGKFVLGFLADFLDDRATIALTEAAVAIGCVLLAQVRLGPVIVPFLVLFGLALNGTSSVLYTRLADALNLRGFGFGYGVYYTISFASSALAPLLFGLIADEQGLPMMYLILGATTLTAMLPLPFLRARPR